jgi:RNA polymerase sigma-70 factor, ECF subfamily
VLVAAVAVREAKRSRTTTQSAYAVLDMGAVARCRRMEPGAWADLVERFSPYVYSIATRAYRLSEHDAEDVFQEVFVRTWQHLDDLRDDASIRPWIGQLTRRLCVDHLRASSRNHARADVQLDLAAPADDGFALLDETLTVRQAIARLPVRQQEIIERFFVLGESQATIAAALGIAEGTVASRICRARERLRLQLAS